MIKQSSSALVAVRAAVVPVAGLVAAACGSSGGPIEPPEPLGGEAPPDQGVQVVSHAQVPNRRISNIAVLDGHAYAGTHYCRPECGARLLVWSVEGSGTPVLVDSVVVDARTVNDVKVDPARGLGVITHEGSQDGMNGITFLDLSDPGDPAVIGRYTTGLESGVHNVFIDEDVLYVAVDAGSTGPGEPSGPLLILDISDPADPVELATYHAGFSLVHDVYVRDGLAFVSHWNAGLVILDVGGAGGSPDSPVELSRIELGGQTHNAWYWPARRLVFVGEEDFQTPGFVHVVDVSDLSQPREVATYCSGDTDTPHKFRMDEDAGLLYVAHYGRGLRVLDVSGPLEDRLDATEVEVAGLRYADESTYSFGLRLADGRVYVSDLNEGLWVLELE